MTKNLYVTPETEVLEVRFEENIMSNPNGVKLGGGGNYSGNDIHSNGDDY